MSLSDNVPFTMPVAPANNGNGGYGCGWGGDRHSGHSSHLLGSAEGVKKGITHLP